MQTEMFCPIWFDHFLKSVKPTDDSPVMLILNEHATHPENLSFLKRALETHVHISCILPHTWNIAAPGRFIHVTWSIYYAHESGGDMTEAESKKSFKIRRVGYLETSLRGQPLHVTQRMDLRILASALWSKNFARRRMYCCGHNVSTTDLKLRSGWPKWTNNWLTWQYGKYP
jgi:hypothetical protein